VKNLLGNTIRAAGLLLGVAIGTPATAEPLTLDNPSQMNGLDVVCTGVGSGKDDPRWTSYPVRIEFANGAAQNLSGAHVALTKHGASVADFECPGAWVLVNGDRGNYHVAATIVGSDARPVSASFVLGKGGQKRIILRFKDFQANQ
jgi:hypothetical protein